MSKKTVAKWLITLTLLVTIWPNHAEAQEPTGQTSKDLTFADLGHGAYTISTTGEEKYFHLYLPSNLVLKEEGHYLDLILSHVPPVPDKLTTLSVYLNRTPLAVITLSEENAEPTVFHFDLPGSIFQVGDDNYLSVKLDSGERCGVRGAAVDAFISEDSRFHLEYSQVPYPADLALYPVPFYEHSFDPQTVYFVLPDPPSATDLSAAATISAGLGKLSAGQVRLAAVRDSQLTPEIRDQHHLIIIGKKGTNGLLNQLVLPLSLEESNLSKGQGVIEELVSPWNPLRMILVVSGLSDAGVSKASLALNRESHFLGMRGPVSIVTAVTPPPPLEQRATDIDSTLAVLGYEDQVVCGTLPVYLEYRFYMPFSWSMMEEPRFVLSFSHSEIIDPKLSSIDVGLNGVPLSSALLNEENINNGLLEIELPAWRIEPGRNKINVSIEMNLIEAEDKCIFMDSCHLWTVINSNSYIHLPVTSLEVEPSLDLFSYPFSQNPDLDDLALVLPDDPQAGDLKGMLDLALMLGDTARGDYLTVEVVTAGDLTETMRKERQLIVLGQPTANALIQELNEWLPQPFEKGTNLLRPEINSVTFVQDPERDAGLIQELASPWNPEKTVLVITGTTGEGVSMAYEMLLFGAWSLAGNVAVVENSFGPVYSYETRTLTLAQESQTVEKVDVDSALRTRLAERWW